MGQIRGRLTTIFGSHDVSERRSINGMARSQLREKSQTLYRRNKYSVPALSLGVSVALNHHARRDPPSAQKKLAAARVDRNERANYRTANYRNNFDCDWPTQETSRHRRI